MGGYIPSKFCLVDFKLPKCDWGGSVKKKNTLIRRKHVFCAQLTHLLFYSASDLLYLKECLKAK